MTMVKDYSDPLRWHIGEIFEGEKFPLVPFFISILLISVILLLFKFYKDSKDRNFDKTFYSKVNDLIFDSNFLLFVNGKLMPKPVNSIEEYEPDNVKVDLDHQSVFVFSNKFNNWRN